MKRPFDTFSFFVPVRFPPKQLDFLAGQGSFHYTRVVEGFTFVARDVSYLSWMRGTTPTILRRQHSSPNCRIVFVENQKMRIDRS
jgi:hypothetical protein